MHDLVVVITGATGALGQTVAQAFADRGARLALLDRDPARLDSLTRRLAQPPEHLLPLTADLRDGRAVQAAADRVAAAFGRVDVLLHLVGGWTGGKSLAESDPADLEAMLGQHAWTTFHVAQAFSPHLKAGGRGRVIVVSSPQADSPSAGMGLYAAGKAAQQALVRALGQELKESGATANIIQVRAIDVEGGGQGTSPSEILAAILYLCSGEAAKLNGVVIPLYS